MSSQQYRLEKLALRRAAGKRVTIKVAGAPFYLFVAARFGGTSPMVCLEPLAGGDQVCKTAAQWRTLGVEI